MTQDTRLTNIRILPFKMLAAGLISVMLLFGSPWGPIDGNAVSAEIFEWNAEDQKTGVYGFLRQLPAYQEKDGDAFSFYARKNIWVFGEGEVMLLEWLPQDVDGQKFKIRFSYLDSDDVDTLTSFNVEDQTERDNFIRSKTEGGLTQTTSVVFDGQAGLYDQVAKANHWLPEILLDPSLNVAFQALLDAKYPTEGDDLPESVDIDLNQQRKDAALILTFDLALDAQIHEAAGPSGDDTRLAIYFPGYTPGDPSSFNDTTREGWNNTISMGKDPELFMNAQGLTYQDLANGNRGWGVVIGWNTHLDYDGKDPGYNGVATDEAVHTFYKGMLTPVGQRDDGLVKRVMAALNTSWAGVPLTGERNFVSHSTGYYLAMDMLNYLPEMWPKVATNRYFAVSPNLKGSSMIGSSGASQDYDSQDDMFRDNWHWDGVYRLNQTTRGILDYRELDNVESHIMLAYGDMMSAGVGGTFSSLAFDQGVVDYTNYQPTSGLDLDDNEYGRRKRFSLYESLYNLRNDGGDLIKTENKAEWENGGDDYLRNFPDGTVISVFGENVRLEKQGADDNEDYDEDHSDMAVRMMVMKQIVAGGNVDYVPAFGNPTEVVPSEEEPGTVVFSWSASEDQSTSEIEGWIGGQQYEVVRKIEGNRALSGWTDKWWQRVALKRAEGGSEFEVKYRTYETIRNVDESGGGDHGLWEFSSAIDSEFINVPTWLDRSFNGKNLWVRVLNGPLRGGFFKVAEVQDYVGKGYSDAGASGSPESFPGKDEITMTVENNPVFAGELPDADEGTGISPAVNYLTLGGIKYQYTAAFYGPHDPSSAEVIFAEYSKINKIFNWFEQDEENNKGTGHFMSVELAEPETYETDTISPTISFGNP